MSDLSSAYIHDIGGDVKGIIGDIKGGVVNQYIIAQYSQAEIHSRNLKPGSPYLGLNKFEPGDKDKFFGREQWIIELSNDLEQKNLLLLLGASGSGKSSLVQAGLIPYLSDQWGTSQLVTIIFVPDRNPFVSFHDRLPKKYKERASQIFRDEPNNSRLINTIKNCKEESLKWIIFIDQFEELFTITPKLERDKFIASLIPLTQQQDNSVKLILAMRSDFVDELREYADLTHEIEKQIRLIRDMTEIELRLAIAEPAARNGVTFEKGLVEQIIHNFYQQAGSLPLLQYTLDLLWREDEPSENNRVLNIATYQNIGGVSGALQKQANRIYNEELNDDERKAAEKIFLELIDLKLKDPISRRVEQAQFKNNKIINKVIEKLINSRLLVSGKYRSTIEVAHEELLRSWQVFQDLIQKKEEIIILRSRLFNDAKQWYRLKEENSDQAQYELWVGYKLERFYSLIDQQELINFDQESKQFIEASNERQKQLNNEMHEKRQQELKFERTKRELANQLLEKERTKNKFLLSLIGATIFSFVAVILGWLVWQGKQQERLLELSIDIHNGQLPPKTIALLPKLLPKLIEKGDEYRKQQKIEKAMSSYRDVLTVINLAQNRIQDDFTVNPSKYKNIFSFDISKYSQDEKRLVQLKKVEQQANQSLTEIILEHRLPKLETYLKEKQYGEKIVGTKPSDFQYQFTEGALQETYKILIIDLGADINKSGFIANEAEAKRMPQEILLEIEKLWRKYTNCGWFRKENSLKYPECQALDGDTLSSLIFYGPADAQRRLEYAMKDSKFPSTVSYKCVQKSILDLKQSLSEQNKIHSQTIGNYLKITGGSGEITDSQYPQLIPVGIRMNQVTGGYDPDNRKMILEINGRLVEIHLIKPLYDNKPVQFVVTKIIRMDHGVHIHRLLPPYNIWIQEGFITTGNLEKVGNQIKGYFQTEGEIWLGEFIGRYQGIIKGEFILNIEPGQKSNIPKNIEGIRTLTSVVEDCVWKN
jgi:energy-coupling factor transporter ATP-binding protein EcfA2